jgi:DNA-binding IclR family transcriptional regulator
MHDFLDRHIDTLVVDDPDERTTRRRSQTELTMQVLSHGAWHRRTPDLATTACGHPFNAQFSPVRRESHIGPLCSVCFTPYELAQSERLAKSDKEGT